MNAAGNLSCFLVLSLAAACSESTELDRLPHAPSVATPIAATSPATSEGQAASKVAVAPSPAAAPVADTPQQDVASLFDLELELVDQQGQTRTLRELAAGGPVLISMFYATCAYACPTLIQDVLRIDRALTPAARARTRVVLVTFDPVHDTPTVLRELATTHSATDVRWTFAGAPDDEVTRELAGALGIVYRRLPDGNYNHTSSLVLLDQRGVVTARIDGLKQDATAFTAVVENL